MPARKRVCSSLKRRHLLADHLHAVGSLTMRPCSSCVSLGVPCILSREDERCEQCFRFLRKCDLASCWPEIDRLLAKEEELREKRLKAEMEAARLRKQERLFQKRRRKLLARERQNIEELEADEESVAGVETGTGFPPSAVAPGSPTGLSQVSF